MLLRQWSQFLLEQNGVQVLVIHPGTAVTDLSGEFGVSEARGGIQPSGSARGMLDMIKSVDASIDLSGHMLSYDGSTIPW